MTDYQRRSRRNETMARARVGKMGEVRVVVTCDGLGIRGWRIIRGDVIGEVVPAGGFRGFGLLSGFNIFNSMLFHCVINWYWETRPSGFGVGLENDALKGGFGKSQRAGVALEP